MTAANEDVISLRIACKLRVFLMLLCVIVFDIVTINAWIVQQLKALIPKVIKPLTVQYSQKLVEMPWSDMTKAAREHVSLGALILWIPPSVRTRNTRPRKTAHPQKESRKRERERFTCFAENGYLVTTNL